MQINSLSVKNYLIIILLTIIFFVLDQTTKWLAVSILQNQFNIINVLPFFSLALVYNSGVSFSFLTGISPYLLSLLSLLAMCIAIYLLFGMFYKVSIIFYLAISSLIGGSLGNLVDRMRLHAVIDFLYVHYGTFSFPVFNLADVFITGCGLIIGYKMLFTKK